MGIIQTNPGSPMTIGGGSGQKIYAYNSMTNTPIQVAGANTSRQQITFHNPGAVDIFVAPVVVQTTGSDAALSPTTSALGGCFRVYANGGSLTITGECQKAWQAFAASAGTYPLTVMESNI